MAILDLNLYLVTNSDGLGEAEFLRIIERACEGGVTLVQLREKEKAGKEYFLLALKVKAITDRFGVPLIINDRVDVALASGASGVHLGQSDLPVAAARDMAGPNKIIGASAKTVEQAITAEAAGADYLGVGAIFPTKTKVQTQLTTVETLKEIIKAVKIPVVAIGGLNATNMSVLYTSGVNGIAVINAIFGNPDPRGAASELRRLGKNLT